MADADEHLDPVVMKELKAVMGEEFQTLVQTFVADSATRLENLAQSIDSGDAENLRRTAHSFKGSASNIGAPRLAEYCRQLENSGRDGNLGRAPGLLTRVRDEYQQVRQELEALG